MAVLVAREALAQRAVTRRQTLAAWPSTRGEVEHLHLEAVLDVLRRYEVPVEARREIHDLLVGRGSAPEAG